MLILEIDMGNTASKWRVCDGDHVVLRGKSPTRLFPDASMQQLQGIGRIRLASVCSDEVTGAAQAALSSVVHRDVDRAITVAAQAGVRNSYADPSRMGVDRWLAMLAAYNKAKTACLVVSCGTAVTIDFVDPDGAHGGGYIFPGLMMMRSALLSNTGRIRYDIEGFDMQRDPGRTTAAAVEHGAVHALLSAVEIASMRMMERWHSGTIFITGGDAGVLLTQLNLPASHKIEVQHVEELVLDGLRFALP